MMKFIESERFLALPDKVQNLYFQLLARADEDGYYADADRLIYELNCDIDDVVQLMAGGFVFPCDIGLLALERE